MFIFPMCHKSDTYDIPAKFIIKAERQLRLKVKVIRSDIGGEFITRTKGYRVWIPEDSKVIETSNIRFQKPQQSNSGVVIASPGLKFSDYKVVEHGNDVIKLNNIPVSLPQNSDSETEDEELSRTDRSVDPVKTTWKCVVVPRPDGFRNNILL
ncbi:uncharacterized protein TNIN_79231 [Trichonephila inaurata madagascariensis]|uniref:Uncharacterized protein n=1 Tax=Trichonephila inaurata madagascariensis TaxID=2747483 RepID=A0A8X6YAI9_9ARAC|nr:uncharacterized protein TNIN_79231 [Trichonephila inaurata madagascariensis]